MFSFEYGYEEKHVMLGNVLLYSFLVLFLCPHFQMSIRGTDTFCISVWFTYNSGKPFDCGSFIWGFDGAQQHFALSLLPVFINGMFPSSPFFILFNYRFLAS